MVGEVVRYQLATGNWGIDKSGKSVRTGVSQVGRKGGRVNGIELMSGGWSRSLIMRHSHESYLSLLIVCGDRLTRAFS